MASIVTLTPSDNLQQALDALEPGSIAQLQPGIYRQKVLIRTPGIQIRGAGAEHTILIWDDYAKKIHADGQEYNTFRTYTLAVCADNVQMRDLSVVNDAGHPEKNGQEVALSVLSDQFVMENCRLSSTQDTLFAGPLPPDLIERYEGFLIDDLRRCGSFSQRYIHCLIEGSVDFIFGCADARFDECEIRSVNDLRQIGYVAAPAHTREQTQGFHFHKCRFTCDAAVLTQSIYLARPWRDFGLAVFDHCHYGPHITQAGFDKWNDTNRDKTARFYERPALASRVAWVKQL